MKTKKVFIHMNIKYFWSWLHVVQSFFFVILIVSSCIAESPEDRCTRLIDVLKGDDYQGKLNAVDELAALIPKTEKAILGLQVALNHRDGSVSERACRYISKLKNLSDAFLPDLINLELQKDGASFYVTDAMIALSPDSVNALIKTANKSDFSNRIRVIRTLGKMKTNEAMPFLLENLKSPNSDLKSAVGKAIIEIHPNDIAFLDELFQRNETLDVAFVISKGIGAETVPIILNRLKLETDHHRKWQLIFALQQIGPDASSAVPQLFEILKTDASLSLDASMALRDIGPAAAHYLADPLKTALKTEDGSMLKNMWTTFEKVGGESSFLLPIVLPYIDSKNRDVRLFSINLVGQIDPANKRLQDIVINDTDEEVRKLVQINIAKP